MPYADPVKQKAYLAAYQREWRARPHVRFKERQDAYYRKNKEAILKRMKWHRILTKYGLTRAEYMAMFRKQKGVCAVCKRPPGKLALAVDHCHDTGRIRGLLCNTCNPVIERVARYLEAVKKHYESEAHTAE